MSSYGNKLIKFLTSEGSAVWQDFLWIIFFGIITLRLVMPAYAESIPETGAAEQGVSAAASKRGGSMVSNPVLRPELFRPPSPSALYRGTSLESTVNQQLAAALVKTAGKAGAIAKTVGQSIGDYMKEKQVEKMQEELVQRFYYNLNFYLDPYRLQPAKRRSIVAKVEEIYIEDGQTDKVGLDTISFREMPGVIKKVYGDLLLEETRNGEVKTYYINGRLQTMWKLKDGMPHGPIVTYYEDSTEILHIDLYDMGKRISRKKYDPLGKLEFEQKYDYDVPDSAVPEAIAGQAPVNITPQDPVKIQSQAFFEPVQPAPIQRETPAPVFHEAE